MGETGPVTTGDTVYDPNFVMMRQEGLRGLVRSTIMTSRLIVLTQDLTADKASAIQVSENAGLNGVWRHYLRRRTDQGAG